MKDNKIRANFHGHVAPDFDPYWLERTHLKNVNLAEFLTDKCIEKEIGIYALTSEFFSSSEPFTQTHRRFDYVADEAKKMSGNYKLEGIDWPIMKIKKGNNEVYFLDNSSISVDEGSEKFKILTLGYEKPFTDEGKNLEETLSDLSQRNISAIPIYPLAMGGMGRKRLIECCKDNKILAVESNAQVCLGFPFKYLLSSLSKKRDREAIDIARQHNKPIIANDDSNWPSWIATAYNEFNAGKINFSSGKSIVKDLISLIKENDLFNFSSVTNYVNFVNWFEWVIFEYGIREKALKSKIKFYQNYPNKKFD